MPSKIRPVPDPSSTIAVSREREEQASTSKRTNPAALLTANRAKCRGRIMGSFSRLGPTVVVHENQAKQNKLIGSWSELGSGGALGLAENFDHTNDGLRLGSRCEGRSYGDCLSPARRPRDKAGLFGTRQPLQIYPGVVSPNVRIDQRSCRIENRVLLHTGKFLVRRFFGLPGGEFGQDGEGPRPAKGLKTGSSMTCFIPSSDGSVSARRVRRISGPPWDADTCCIL